MPNGSILLASNLHSLLADEIYRDSGFRSGKDVIAWIRQRNPEVNAAALLRFGVLKFAALEQGLLAQARLLLTNSTGVLIEFIPDPIRDLPKQSFLVPAGRVFGELSIRNFFQSTVEKLDLLVKPGMTTRVTVGGAAGRLYVSEIGFDAGKGLMDPALASAKPAGRDTPLELGQRAQNREESLRAVQDAVRLSEQLGSAPGAAPLPVAKEEEVAEQLRREEQEKLRAREVAEAEERERIERAQALALQQAAERERLQADAQRRQQQAELQRQQAELQQRLKRAEEDARRREQQDEQALAQRTRQEQAARERLTAEVEAERKKRLEIEQRLAAAEARERERQATEARLAQEAAAPKVFANRKALVIGNDHYAEVPKLNNAVSDAESMASALQSVGFSVFKHLNVDEKRFKAALRDFRSRVEPGDEVVVFFAGHGVQLSNANYLLPVDIKGESEEQIKDEGIQLQRVLDDIQDRRSKFALAVIDACRDNPFKGSGRAIGGRGLAPTTAATGQMIVFSAGAGQQALDRLGKDDKEKNGLFTRIFVKEMVKPGVSVDRVLRNVRTEVVRLAKSVGHDQTPALYDQAVGDFFFRQ